MGVDESALTRHCDMERLGRFAGAPAFAQVQTSARGRPQQMPDAEGDPCRHYSCHELS